MKIEVLGSTKPDYFINPVESLRFSGIAAGVCYMPTAFQMLSNEPIEKTMHRIQSCIYNGHHSVLEHVVINLYLENVPKILAMILNNEKCYATSEKSSRYTKIQLDTADGKLYQKWVPILEKQIAKIYPEIPSPQVKKLSFENARYMISVFAPVSSMVYTVSLRQLSYISGWMKKYIESTKADNFTIQVKTILSNFLSTQIVGSDMTFSDLSIAGVSKPNRVLSLFAQFMRNDEFGENYCVNYQGTFAYLAQAQRHRTLKYEFGWWKKSPKYYVPPIIARDEDLRDEWISDIVSLHERYPQGRLLDINERGTLDDFLMKCYERICGMAQLETAQQTKLTLNYLARLFEEAKPDLYYRLAPFTFGARCTFPEFECKSPCIWGRKKALTRIV